MSIFCFLFPHQEKYTQRKYELLHQLNIDRLFFRLHEVVNNLTTSI
ncbi:unnamed protein product [Amoebophrya sp. A25]|nr:unnamed protein product [Amoebophrya sp. A25]|eukprot:GSA25T00011254001.1